MVSVLCGVGCRWASLGSLLHIAFKRLFTLMLIILWGSLLARFG